MERYSEMLEALTPRQLVVVALVLDGLTAEQVAEELGLDRRAVYRRLWSARRRLLRRFPDLAGEVEGRSRRIGAVRGAGCVMSSGG